MCQIQYLLQIIKQLRKFNHENNGQVLVIIYEEKNNHEIV